MVVIIVVTAAAFAVVVVGSAALRRRGRCYTFHPAEVIGGSMGEGVVGGGGEGV